MKIPPVIAPRGVFLPARMPFARTEARGVQQGKRETSLSLPLRAPLPSPPGRWLAWANPTLGHSRLRATPPGLRTPDAIHASTAIKSACALFLTNDPAFRRVPNLTVTFLSDLLTP